MKTLLQSAVGVYLDTKGWQKLQSKIQQLPFAAITDRDRTLMAILRNYYHDFSEMELVLLLSDNLNSLENAEGSQKADNECSFLVRNKVLVLYELLDQRLKEIPTRLLSEQGA